MATFNAVLDSVAGEQVTPDAVRTRIEVIGAASQTPQVWRYDAVSLRLTRLAAGAGAPELGAREGEQILNGAVVDVHNQEASGDWSVVNVTIEGIGPFMNLHPGDAVRGSITRLAAGAGAPSVSTGPVVAP